jgi:hypothetical protein
VGDGSVTAQQPFGSRRAARYGDGRPQQHVEEQAGDLVALLVGEVLQLVGENQLEGGAAGKGKGNVGAL